MPVGCKRRRWRSRLDVLAARSWAELLRCLEAGPVGHASSSTTQPASPPDAGLGQLPRNQILPVVVCPCPPWPRPMFCAIQRHFEAGGFLSCSQGLQLYRRRARQPGASDGASSTDLQRLLAVRVLDLLSRDWPPAMSVQKDCACFEVWSRNGEVSKAVTATLNCRRRLSVFFKQIRQFPHRSRAGGSLRAAGPLKDRPHAEFLPSYGPLPPPVSPAQAAKRKPRWTLAPSGRPASGPPRLQQPAARPG